MHRPTIEVYERSADTYASRRGVQRPERAEAFAGAVDGLRLDAGCGPGHYLDRLGRPVVALDAATSMLAAAGRAAPGTPAVRADLAHLPFGRRTFAGVWSSKALQHLPAGELPLALAEVHRVLRVGGRFDLTVFAGSGETVTTADSDDLPGRWFTWWEPDRLVEVVRSAGFGVDGVEVGPLADGHPPRIDLTATALPALPDHVRPGLRLLCCGLNPSLHAAEAGVPYVTRSNRFWPALTAAGLATCDRDPRHLARVDGVGLTDLVQRATPRAAELRPEEYRAGVARLARLCAWLRPAAVVMVGLAGWRVAVDRGAAVGWQPERLGGVPVYVMPSTSGLNARIPVTELADHLSAAADGPRPHDAPPHPGPDGDGPDGESPAR